MSDPAEEFCPACSAPFEYLSIGDDGVWFECEECGWGERWGPGPRTAEIEEEPARPLHEQEARAFFEELARSAVVDTADLGPDDGLRAGTWVVERTRFSLVDASRIGARYYRVGDGHFDRSYIVDADGDVWRYR